MKTKLSYNSRFAKTKRLFSLFIILMFGNIAFAHQTPAAIVLLDASPNKVAMELQLPIAELELAFGDGTPIQNPESFAERMAPQIRAYLLAHIHAYVQKDKPWAIEISGLQMDKGKEIESGGLYWELKAQLLLIPNLEEDTRKFTLDYDVIMHQVANHIALVSIRSDWEQGKAAYDAPAEAGIIRRNTKDDIVYPLEINLEQGSWWKGFKSMLALGMQHIKEGTDHLLFLIVLLLPAMLLVNRKKWGKFGGTKYSIIRLLKIVTAFTIGHSVTLLIGALGWLKLPTQPVEILIAFSILVSAIHAIYPIFPGKETYVAAGFGLIHGLAFATILSTLKLGAGTLALSIVGFNLGIELMQLFIIALIIPWLIILSKTTFYKWVRPAFAFLSTVAALAWIAERVSGNGNFITAFVTKASQYGLWCIITLAVFSVVCYISFQSEQK